mgnify:CR=1 FL=1
MKRTACLAFLLLTLAASTAGAASLFETVGSPDLMHPFNLRVIGLGPESAYYNPALLIGQKDQIKLGFGMSAGDLNIAYMHKDPAYNVPGEIADRNSNLITKAGPSVSREDTRYTPLPTEDLINRQRGTYDPDFLNFYTLLGGNMSFLDGWLAAALYVELPASQLTGQVPYYADERDQFFGNSLHFELLGDRLESFHLVAAIAGKVGDWLSLGIGATVGVQAVAQIGVYVADASNPEYLLFDPAIQVHALPLIAPHFGFVVRPIEDLTITGTLHLPNLNFDFDLDVDIQVRGFDELYEYKDPNNPDAGRKDWLDASLRTNYGSDPLRFALGLSYTLPEARGWRVTLMANALYTMWSTYRDRHAEKPLDKWSDTVKPAFGVNVASEDREFGFDWTYHMSPVPPQTGRSNYVDNDRVAFALGYTEYFRFEKFTLAGGVSFQTQVLLKETTTKTRVEDGSGSDAPYNSVVDEYPEMTNAEGEVYPGSVGFQTNNPGYPGYWTRGIIFGSGIYVKFIF